MLNHAVAPDKNGQTNPRKACNYRSLSNDDLFELDLHNFYSQVFIPSLTIFLQS
jgi:hypothetical protein